MDDSRNREAPASSFALALGLVALITPLAVHLFLPVIPAVKLALSPGKLVLSVTNPDQGSAVEELEAGYDAAPIDIGFSSRYLLDILNQLESDTTLFLLADPGSPTLIQDRDGASVLYVLMPMRV